MSIDHNRIKVADLEKNQPNKILITNSEGEIGFTEINNLSVLSNVITTVKYIPSTILAGQNVAGLVTYINSLSPNLTVGTNEILKYTITDTGKVFELNVRGRNFGVGQPLILANDIIEVTDFLNKEIKLSNYPSTRNDGQLSTNKVLSTDLNGNIKLYTLPTFSVYPAPFLEEVLPLSVLPNTTGDITLKGSFFTPNVSASITGQIVNYVTFINDNLIKINVTTGSVEGNFDITLNNGTSATFSSALLVVLGTVYKPKSSDWTLLSNIDVSTGDFAKVTLPDVTAQGQWIPPIDYTKNFRVSFKFTPTPLNPTSNGNSYFGIYDTLGNHVVSFRQIFNLYVYYGTNKALATNITNDVTKKLEVRKIGSLITLHANDGALIFTLSDYVTLSRNCYIALNMTNFDVSEIKYIVTQ